MTISDGERDPDLGSRLLHELSGILNWALDGLSIWRTHHLMPPPEVRAATNEYRAEMDPFGEFIDDCCVESNQAASSTADLYAWYQWWCSQRGVEAIRQNAFSRSLTERGLKRTRTAHERIWLGIGIRPDAGGDGS